MIFLGRLRGMPVQAECMGGSPYFTILFCASGNTSIRKGSGNSLTPPQIDLIQSMTEFSEGTNFLVTEDGTKNV
jgi:hypothetical protein